MGCRFDGVHDDDVPAPATLFKAPPPPADIASRRKVQNKPAALDADAMRGRPPPAPRTMSQTDSLRRIGAPLHSPMRRIVSAGGNRPVLSGRVQKSSLEASQRSPLHFQTFHDVGTLMHAPTSMQDTPTPASTFAPPTPLSPHDRHPTDVSVAASPPDWDPNSLAGYYASADPLVSPPETPHAVLGLTSSTVQWTHPGAAAVDAWNFDVTDEPQYTPAHDSFPLDALGMPRTSYLTSQPVTPGRAAFDASRSTLFKFDSPPLHESPPAYLPDPHAVEYAFPDAASQQLSYAMADALARHKTFEFSHSTPADFGL